MRGGEDNITVITRRGGIFKPGRAHRANASTALTFAS